MKYAHKIKGTSFGNRQQLLKKVSSNTVLKLVREKNNPHDENAIAVHADLERFNEVAGWHMAWQHMGYIAKEVAERLAPLIDEGKVDIYDVDVLNLLKIEKKNSYLGLEIVINNIDSDEEWLRSD